MLRYLFCCVGLCLLAACGSVRPADSPDGDAASSYLHSGLGAYAQARLFWNEGNAEQALILTRRAQAADPDTPYPILLEAEIMLKSGRVQDSLAAVDRAIKVAPDYRPSYLLGGSIMSTMGKTKEAASYLRNAVRLEPGKEDAVLHLVTSLMQLFEYEESVTVLKSLIKAKPESAVGNYYLAKVYSQMKLYRESIGYYQKALELRPEFIQATIDMAISYEALGEYDKAIAAYKDALEDAENRAPLIQHLIQLFIQNRRYEEALTYLKKLDQMGLATAETNRKIGLIYLELEQYDDAIKVFSQMLEADPDAHQIRLYLGSAFEEKNELERAVAEFHKIPADAPVYTEAVGHLAFIYKELGRGDEAVKLLEQTIAANQDKLDLYLSLATLHDSLQHPAEGLKLLLGVETRFSSDPKFQFRMGILYDKLGKRAESIERMKKVVELNPKDAQAHNFLGYTYAEMGINLEEALAHVKRALEIRPDDGFFIDSLGWVYYQMKRYDDAVRYLEKSVELVTDDPTILEHLGDAHLARKEPKHALKYYKKARALDPRKKGLDEKIRRILRGELEEK